MILMCKFKEISRTKIKIIMFEVQYGDWYTLTACMNTQETQSTENETFLGIPVTCTIFLNLCFGYFIHFSFPLFNPVNEVNSKHSQTSRSVVHFQGKMFIFKELQMPFKRHFKFQHFSRSSQTCTTPVIDAQDQGGRNGDEVFKPLYSLCWVAKPKLYLICGVSNFIPA